MKNALLIYKTYNGCFNIGDYIQSLAAKQFLDQTDELICRENLNEYDGPQVKIILNGWFTHEPLNWPPSSKIHPLFISFHINSVAESVLLNDKNIEYFKKNQPIGCRDYRTAKKLEQNGIKSYFSGCLTLTLGKKYLVNKKREGVFFVDPYYKIERGFFKLFFMSFYTICNFRKINIIAKKKYHFFSIKNILKTSFFYKQYAQIFDKELLCQADYITHKLKDTYNSETEKFSLAEQLIRTYSTAKLVITTRIHCALPCLSLDTPCIYVADSIKSETSESRLTGIKELFNVIEHTGKQLVMSTIKLPSEKINRNSKIKNKDLHVELIDKLIKSCEMFIKNQ